MCWTEVTVLVERARAGDSAAYGELVERFQGTVYAVALARLHNVSEAQELTQEVFVHGMQKIPQLRDARCFAGWLRRITVRMAINRFARKAPFQGVEQEVLESTAAPARTPLDTLVLDEQKAALWGALNRLKDEDRSTLVAFYIQSRSLKQMSRQFEAPIGTIKRRLHVARKRLKRLLEAAAEVAVGAGGDADLPEEKDVLPKTKRPRRRRTGRTLELACVS